MTVVGSDAWADAPLIELGTSSAYTPNTGYGTEAGEPSAWGGKTAWWKYTATADQFVYVDVVHSTGGPVRSWSYRQDGSDITGLFQLSAPTAGAQGGFNAAAGTTYYIRVDSDGTDASYVLSVGADVYDYHTERRTLTTPPSDDPTAYVEDYFNGTGLVSGPGETTSRAILADNVQAAEPDVMHVGDYATETVAQYPTYAGIDWYSVNDPDQHPVIVYTVESDNGDPVSAPTGFELVTATVKASIWSTDGPDLYAEPDGDVPQVRISGGAGAAQSLRYYDEDGNVAGDVPSGLIGVEHTFSFPPTLTPGQAEFAFNDSQLRFAFTTNRVGAFPAGSWFVGTVAVEFLYQSETPVPYVPPGPPLLETVPKLRLYPRDDTLGFAGAARNYPPPRRRRNYGQQP